MTKQIQKVIILLITISSVSLMGINSNYSSPISEDNIIWEMSYGGSESDYPYSIIQTTDNGLAIIGKSASFISDGFDSWVVKTDSAGSHQWNESYGSPFAISLTLF